MNIEKNNKEQQKIKARHGKLIERAFYIGLVSGVIFGLSPIGERLNEKFSQVEKAIGLRQSQTQTNIYEKVFDSEKDSNLRYIQDS